MSRNTWDGYDRIIKTFTYNTDGTVKNKKTTNYDGLDRVASQFTKLGAAPGKTTAFTYLGLTDKVLAEETQESGAWKITATYTYGAGGERVSMFKPEETAGNRRQVFYSYNPHSDVEVVTGNLGGVSSTYRYTAYGQSDPKGTTGEDANTIQESSTTEAHNPWRFNSKRWDQATRSYDMGFRDYSPGLNQYLSRDMYNGALADLALGADPWNTNRYAFAGGNPITGIELDGHSQADPTGGGYCNLFCQLQNALPEGSGDGGGGDGGDDGGLLSDLGDQLSSAGQGAKDFLGGAAEKTGDTLDSIYESTGLCWGGYQSYDHCGHVGDEIREIESDLEINRSSRAHGLGALCGDWCGGITGLLKGTGKFFTKHFFKRNVDETAQGAPPQFIVNAAGDILDTSRITIPEDKFVYLLKNPKKSGVFKDSMRFDQAGLDAALRSHLTTNFGTASTSVPMKGGGTKFSVRGLLTGPSGQTWNITSAWGVDVDGTVRLITATP